MAPSRSQAILSSRNDAGGGLLLVSLDVDDDVARGYTTPGQYLQLQTAAGNGYFVLASDVGERPFQLLVKSSGGASEVLATAPLGTSLTIAGPLGAGFSIERMMSRHVAVCVVASALGVARSVIARRIAEGVGSLTHLFLGLRAPVDLPIPDEVASWTDHGITVVLCLSRAELHHHPEVLPKAHRVVGYVQRALAKALEAGTIPHGTLVITAGPDPMLADMRALAKASGAGGDAVPAGPSIEVLTNV